MKGADGEFERLTQTERQLVYDRLAEALYVAGLRCRRCGAYTDRARGLTKYLSGVNCSCEKDILAKRVPRLCPTCWRFDGDPPNAADAHRWCQGHAVAKAPSEPVECVPKKYPAHKIRAYETKMHPTKVHALEVHVPERLTLKFVPGKYVDIKTDLPTTSSDVDPPVFDKNGEVLRVGDQVRVLGGAVYTIGALHEGRDVMSDEPMPRVGAIRCERSDGRPRCFYKPGDPVVGVELFR